MDNLLRVDMPPKPPPPRSDGDGGDADAGRDAGPADVDGGGDGNEGERADDAAAGGGEAGGAEGPDGGAREHGGGALSQAAATPQDLDARSHASFDSDAASSRWNAGGGGGRGWGGGKGGRPPLPGHSQDGIAGCVSLAEGDHLGPVAAARDFHLSGRVRGAGAQLPGTSDVSLAARRHASQLLQRTSPPLRPPHVRLARLCFSWLGAGACPAWRLPASSPCCSSTSRS